MVLFHFRVPTADSFQFNRLRFRYATMLRTIIHCLLVAGFFFTSAEFTCRVDDWLREGFPVLSMPDSDTQLVLEDGSIRRGRPHGRFKKWELNAFGFRGPEIGLEPSPGAIRVMLLGASESFGLYESEQKEYPAQLRAILHSKGNYEVINAAVAGMTVRSMIPYWEHWASQFHPHLVVIYPTPLFYLNLPWRETTEEPSTQVRTVNRDGTPPLKLGSRLLFRLKDHIHTPRFIQWWRDERGIAAKTAGKGSDWLFASVPKENLDSFIRDLEELAEAIRLRGAEPILMTHAVRCMFPPEAQDSYDLHHMRVHFPRATESVMAAFEAAAVKRTIELGREKGWEVIDIAAVMNGKRDLFADLSHFTDRGAAIAAQLIAGHVVTLSPVDK